MSLTFPPGEETASSMISPVMEVIGVISAWASGGRSSRTESIRSETSWRARYDVRAPVELDPDDGQADRAGRAHAAHAGQAVDGGLDREGDVLLDLVGGEAGRFGHDDDGRRVEFREHIDRSARQAEGDDGQQQAGGQQDQRRVGQAKI